MKKYNSWDMKFESSDSRILNGQKFFQQPKHLPVSRSHNKHAAYALITWSLSSIYETFIAIIKKKKLYYVFHSKIQHSPRGLVFNM